MRPIALLFFLTFCHGLPAQTRHVPAQFATIQAAVNAAAEGDTVLVAPGVYYENVQLTGNNIVLTSRYFLDHDPRVIEQTIIDGSQPAHPDTASCVLITQGETAATVVQGFTLRGGTGTVWLDPFGAGTYREGGGVLIAFSSPVIRHNVIRDNTVPKTGANVVSNGGGGIRAGEGAPLIEGNVIVRNRADGYGGGIVLNFCPDAVVRGNLLARNAGGKQFNGGSLWVLGAVGSTVTAENNTFAYNTATGVNGKGGAVWLQGATLDFRNNVVWGNTQSGGKQVAKSGGTLTAAYNDVQDGLAGATNFTADPLFDDTLRYYLAPGSPAIDGGDPGGAYSDFSFNDRRAAFPARGALRNDAGAYGGPSRGPAAYWRSGDLSGDFTRVHNSPVVSAPGDSRSVNWVDIDGDHDLDLQITNGPEQGENNFLYRNNGTGGFTAVTGQPIVQDNRPSDGASWADLDNDGDLDCFVANWYGEDNLLYRNDGAGNFEQITTGPVVTDGGHSETGSWGDYDADGLVDLYVANSGGTLKNFLYRNLGNGGFQKITAGAVANDAAASRNVTWTDYDLDGDVDLFVTNESNQNENLYRNDNGTLNKVTGGPLLTAGGKTMSASWADIDNDGDPDVVLANDGANLKLFENLGGGDFQSIPGGAIASNGGHAFGSQWADVDHDADLDLFITQSFGTSQWRNLLFLNDGAGNFTRDTASMIGQDFGWSYGSAFGDFDRDGDLDLAVATCYNANQPDYLYENHAAETAHHWLAVECQGTISNRAAIGARVRVLATIDGEAVWQVREVSAQSGYCGQNQLAPHFGLGSAAVVDSLVVEWPSGLRQAFAGVAADQYVSVVEGDSISGVGEAVAEVLTADVPSPNPFSEVVRCGFGLARPGHVTVEVVDGKGTFIARLLDRRLGAGQHVVEWREHAAPAGHYSFVFRFDGGVVVRRVVKAK